MGEYAMYAGEEIKIGTCESMYYLRADQAHRVTPLEGNVHPIGGRDGIRFRFPWPDEDGTAPGAFEDPFRGHRLHAVRSPESVPHYTVQFKAANGYLVSLPCPEQSDSGTLTTAAGESAYRVGRNGYGGATELVQQRWYSGRLVAVLKCKGCGAMWRLPELSDAQPVIDALHAEADGYARDAERNGTAGDALHAVRLRSIADRVALGYDRERNAFAVLAQTAGAQ